MGYNNLPILIKKCISIFTFFLTTLLCYSQPIVPYIANFTKNDYKAASRNWAVETDSEGSVYFGNSKGLLRYTGVEWQLLPMPGGKIVRSIMIDKNDRIYVGSFEEFGYFEKTENGKFKYTSLSDLLDNYNFHNEEIWNIISENGKIYFRSFSSYFTYSNNKVNASALPFTFLFLDKLNNSLYASIEEKGFYSFNGNDFNMLIPSSQINNDNVTGIFPFNKSKIILATTHNGLFIYEDGKCNVWANEVNEKLKKAFVNRCIMTRDSAYIIGTISDGIYALNKEGKLLWNINTSNGLLNNTVLGMGTDGSNNIWVALDDGISYIKYNSQIRFIKSFQPNIGYVYSVKNKDNYLYLATNQGIFYISLKDEEYIPRQIPNTNEQAWDLFEIDSQLFCGHNQGTFEIEGTNAIKVSSVKGGTSMRRGTIHGQDVLIQSTYTYLVVYKKNKSGKWEFSNIVDNFIQPIRSLEIDSHGNIWAQHFYKGLYCVKLSPDLKTAEKTDVYYSLDKKKNKSKESIIRVFKLRGRIICCEGDGFYKFDELTDSIVPFKFSGEKISAIKDVRRVIPINDDLYWLVCPNEFIFIDFKENDVEILNRIPFSDFYNMLSDDEENLTPISIDKFIFCLNNGIAVFDKNIRLEPDMERVLRIDKITKNNQNSITFHVEFPAFPGENISFEYRLKGVDDNENEISQKNEIQYFRLYPGEFVFEVKAIDNLGNVKSKAEYAFTIEPPFYQRKEAIFVYIILIILVLYLIFKVIQKYIKHKEAKIKQQQLEIRQKELEKQEQQIIKLEKEKLEQELIFKSKEIAGSAMSIIQKDEILDEIKRELSEQKKLFKNESQIEGYQKIIKKIDSHLTSEDEWEVFQSNFDRIHENFFRDLKTNYPELTPNDLKFCALLRLNQSSKEIANMMNISVKGVEVARSRLRKKFGIAPEESLVGFLIGFKGKVN